MNFPLLLIAAKLKQIVTLPTLGNKILDILLTNLSHLLAVPVIHPPVLPDAPSQVPSDHSVPVTYPLCDSETGDHDMRQKHTGPSLRRIYFGRVVSFEFEK